MINVAVRPPAEPRLTWRRALFAAVLVVGLLIAAGFIWLRSSLARTEFPMKDVPDAEDAPLAGGLIFSCKPDPDSEVLKYPRFVSSRPLFASLLYSEAGDSKHVRYPLALDESKGTDSGYDVLYFDANTNQDLTDDSPLRIADKTVSTTDGSPILLFDRITLHCDYGPAVGVRGFGVIPFFFSLHSEQHIGFRRDSVRRGNIRIGRHRYEATLSPYGLSGRYGLRGPYDLNGHHGSPATLVHLTSPARVVLLPHRWKLFDYWPPRQGCFPLSSLFTVDGRWYSFACTPLGDRLKVTLYEGSMGTFEIAGGVSDARAAGEISNTDSYIRIASSPPPYEFGWTSVKSVDLPAGDYFLDNMLVTTGIYDVWLERHDATTGTESLWKTAQPRYVISIRKETPFTLSLPDKPNVIFGMPDDRQRFLPGQTLVVRSMFVIPDTDVCIRDMNMRRAPLTVDVAVTDSSGQTLARGALPIRDLIYEGFSWQIPDDIDLSGSEEKLTVTVTCDTDRLFGKIEDKREIVIENAQSR